MLNRFVLSHGALIPTGAEQEMERRRKEQGERGVVTVVEPSMEVLYGNRWKNRVPSGRNRLRFCIQAYTASQCRAGRTAAIQWEGQLLDEVRLDRPPHNECAYRVSLETGGECWRYNSISFIPTGISPKSNLKDQTPSVDPADSL